MIQPLGGNSKVYRIFKDPVMVGLCAAILILSLFIINDHLTNWKTVTFVNGNDFSEIRTKADNISLFLKEQNITMKKLDYIVPGLHTVISDKMKIKLFRMEEKIVAIREKIKIPVKIIKIGILKKGVTRVIYKGRCGVLKKVYKLLKKNGIECQRELIYREIVSNPIPELLFVGSGKYKNIRFKNNHFSITPKFISSSNNLPTLHVPENLLPENLIVENQILGKFVTKNDIKKREFLISGIDVKKIPELYKKNRNFEFKIIN